MKMLEKKYLTKIDKYLRENCRLLEKRLFDYYFRDGEPKEIVDALKLYQNQDGGFGQGLESDFRMPDSSPMATSIGVRILKDFDSSKKAKRMLKQAVNYFEYTYNEKRKGWYALSKKVNDYPHTPWWHYDKEKGMTVIDENWGNPSAEIIAYLYKYKSYVKKLNVEELVDYAIKQLNEKQEFNSANEVFCYIKLYRELPEDKKEEIKENLSEAISQVVEYDEDKWEEYVPLPLHFVTDPKKECFDIDKESLKKNLNFYIDLIKENTVIKPPWGKSFYTEGLEPAYNEWKGVLTVEALKTLDNFNRIES